MDRDRLAAQLAEGRSIEAIARATRPRSVHRRLLGQQVRPGVPARASATRPAAGSSASSSRRSSKRACRSAGIADAARRHLHDGAPLAAALRTRDAASRRLAETAPARAARSRNDRGELPRPRAHDVRAPWGRRVPVPAVSQRRRASAPPGGQASCWSPRQAAPAPLCGYDRSLAGLHFHHLDPAAESFALSRRGVTRSLEAARAEAREVRAAVRQLPRGSRERRRAIALRVTTMSASRTDRG